ncbi:MAG: PilZ domain-containing protein [Methylococcaceae bacterium]
MDNRRICKRYALVAEVKLTHPSFGDYITTTTDASDSGVFIIINDLELPPVGSTLKLQIINNQQEMPIKEVTLTRVSSGQGAGLAFCDWDIKNTTE